MAIDDRGSRSIKSRSGTWSQGGIIFERSNRDQIVETWHEIKIRLCGTRDVELKWSHFFAGPHQADGNPLINRGDPLRQLDSALLDLFRERMLFPVNQYIRKKTASVAVFKKGSSELLDVDVLWVGILAQYALFLQSRNGVGEIWYDQLGSRQEEDRRQTDLVNSQKDQPGVPKKNTQMMQRLIGPIKFLDSQHEPVIQVADFVSGVIWGAAEGELDLITKHISSFVPESDRTYLLLNVN